MRLGPVFLLSTLVLAQNLTRSPFVPGQYIVLLDTPPVAERFPSRDAFRSAAADSYTRVVESRQSAIRSDLAARGIAVHGSVSAVLNAVFVTMPASRADEVRALPGVAGVRPVRRGTRHINRATQLANAPAAWTALGGQSNAGKGILIAVLDSGIDQTHPAFQDSTLTIPAGFPKCNATSDCRDFTNNKVIVARSYVPWIANADPAHPDPTVSSPDDYSARDRDGHGTAVASVAAANTNSGSVTFQGIAPKAWLGNYKIYGSTGVNDFPPETVWEMAINDALNDGKALGGNVVAVFSSGYPALSGPLDQGAACGLSGSAPCDPLAMAFENAARAGLVIAASAGNDGGSGLQYPNFTSVSSPAFAPSVLAVGATLNSHVLLPTVGIAGPGAPSNLQHIAATAGDSFSPFATGLAISQQAPLADAGDACAALPPGSLAGAFALIPARGGCALVLKASNAEAAGAIGIIFYSATSAVSAPEGVDQFDGPTVMVSNADGLALKQYIDANPNQAAVIDMAGAEQDLSAYSSALHFFPALAPNQLASYSSQGPALGSYAIKPDLVATGGLDVYLAPDPNNFSLVAAPGMYLAAQNFDPQGELYSPNRYAAANGTSFAAPLAAGAAALVKQAHPDYTAAQVRSALVNNAGQDVLADDFGDAVTTQWVGAGRLDAAAAVISTITAEPLNLSFGALQSGTPLPAPMAVALVNHGSAAVTLAVSVQAKAFAAGMSVAVDKSSVTVPAGGAATINVSLSGSVPAAGAYSGNVNLQATGILLHIPYLFLVGDGKSFNIPFILGNGDGIAGQDLGAWSVQVTDSAGVAVPNATVGFTSNPRGAMTFRSVDGEPACTPTSSTTSVVCPSDRYGYAWVDILLGPNPGSPSVAVRVTGLSGNTFGITSRVQPTISAGGVLPVGNVDSGTPIAPGSYVAIYGAGLSDLTDANPYQPYPLTLDGVTVSFDVPSAGISLPGRVIFVSPNQVNVQVPWELQGQSSAAVKVTINEFSFGNVVMVPVADASPAFFHAEVDALDASYRVISAANPAVRGQVVQLYLNGLGPVNNQPETGVVAAGSAFATTKTTPIVMIGGQQAELQFSGLAPGFQALYQVNAVVPVGIAASSAVPITVSIGGRVSKQAAIAVR